MLSKILVHFAACAALLYARAEGAPPEGRGSVRVREQAMNFGFHAGWMRSDGAGGVYIGDRFRILRFDSTGRTEDIRLPRGIPGRADALAERISVGPDGRLQLRDGMALFRYSKGKGWEETAVPADPAASLSLPDSTVPVPSPDTDSCAPVAAGPRRPPDLWAVGGDGCDTLGLFLASAHPERWRRTVFTVGPIAGPPERRDTLPFPADWTGPSPGRHPVAFDRESAFLVSQPQGTWIALGGLLALKRGSAWTLFHSQDQSLAYLKGTGYVDQSTLHYRLTRPLPYLYTAFLAASALQTGPGWAGETAWAFGGIALGTLVGGGLGCIYGGMCASPNASCGSGMSILYPLIAVPLIAGIWALESHVASEHGDRKWARRGAAGLGALSGVGLYFAFPTESGWVITGALAGASLGAVAGYRLAWLP